jgi:hypothetical protein
MNFDGAAKGTPAAPRNDLSDLPEHGSPAWEQYLAAEKTAREPWASGINPDRNAVLAADAAAAKATRERFGKA